MVPRQREREREREHLYSPRSLPAQVTSCYLTHRPHCCTIESEPSNYCIDHGICYDTWAAVLYIMLKWNLTIPPKNDRTLVVIAILGKVDRDGSRAESNTISMAVLAIVWSGLKWVGVHVMGKTRVPYRSWGAQSYLHLDTPVTGFVRQPQRSQPISTTAAFPRDRP